ncbi:MAG: HAD-IB family hydrolase [Gammaproteobacteria bacterium]|nr:HAD-IB family hydrolase [Gammaproteobacteria bacterium]
MSLAIFDLDNTLLAGDSDYAWGQFLVAHNLVDRPYYERENERFGRAYQDGALDIHGYLAFALKPLAQHDLSTLEQWRRDFMHSKILPMIQPKAQNLIDKHRQAGDTLVIITSTMDFIAQPIAQEFGIEHLIASQAEILNGRFTGNVVGTPCYRHGKVERLQTWVDEHGESMTGSWFYSDSHTDLPLLNAVDNPVAVNPDETLRAEAQVRGWPIIDHH